MRIEVHPGGHVVVTMPKRFASAARAARFVERHAAWIERMLRRMRTKTVIALSRSDIPRLKDEARAVVEERCAHFARLYGVRFRSIAIRAQKTRWGSCSHRGALSFNYKVAALPAHLRDYVIVHEICHLLELNHSRAFWNHVARAVPEHKAARKELRDMVFSFS
jgi:predicted metal-dependent hydrolase